MSLNPSAETEDRARGSTESSRVMIKSDKAGSWVWYRWRRAKDISPWFHQRGGLEGRVLGDKETWVQDRLTQENNSKCTIKSGREREITTVVTRTDWRWPGRYPAGGQRAGVDQAWWGMCERWGLFLGGGWELEANGDWVDDLLYLIGAPPIGGQLAWLNLE